MHFAILKNEFDDNFKNWIAASKKYGHSYHVIDFISADWLDMVESAHYDGFLACPPGREELYKKLYDERLYILEKLLDKFVYPKFNEISLHENKKFLSYWLKANNIPHPKTSVFYHKAEALKDAESGNLPVVGKFNIGASGKGVTVFRDRHNLIKYIETAFSDGLRQSWGPNFKMGGWGERFKKIIKNPSRIKQRLETYKKVYNERQKNFVILQEFIPHAYEWRIVKIGESYFGHQKVKQGDKASGTKGINYVIPPDSYLNFVRNLCEKFDFNSMAVDLFEDGKGGLLVNELQTIFGHVQAFICEKDGKPGRLTCNDGLWHFEEGTFNTNLSYDLRLANAISLIENQPGQKT